MSIYGEREAKKKRKIDTEVSSAEKGFLLDVIKSDEYKSYQSEISGKADKLAPDWIYDNIDEVAKNSRKIYFIYISLLSYSLLTIATTPVQDFFLGQDVILPLINATVPLQYFIILIPLMALGLFIYNQLYLVKVNKLINFAIQECSEANPDCIKKRGKECNIRLFQFNSRPSIAGRFESHI